MIVGIKPPTSEHLRRAATDLGLALGEADIEEFYALTTETIEALRPLDRMSDYLPPVTYPRSPGTRPSPEQDPLHAWYVQTSVRCGARIYECGCDLLLS